MKILLDTCALIWWTLDPEQLNKKALTKINSGELFISSISLWEIGLKIKNKKLDINMTIETYCKKLRQLENLSTIPVDENIWLKNLSLDWPHRDPADRTIVATASLNNCTIATSDEKIISFYKKTII